LTKHAAGPHAGDLKIIRDKDRRPNAGNMKLRINGREQARFR
jgi:hypothetical protein